MYRSLLYVFLTGLGLTVGLLACDTPDPEAVTGTFVIQLDNVAGNQNLQLNTGTYRNALGESFTPTAFNYFVSNIRLIRTNGEDYVVPQDSSYFLVRETDPASQRITLKNVPYGDYKGVSFVLGVDSLRSTMDISRRTGALDPGSDHTGANGMYWSWNSGYIFMKLEGTSPSAPVDATGSNTFRYHIGFFGGRDTRTINNLKTIPVLFGTDVAQVDAEKVPTVLLQADVLKIFDGPTLLSIKTNPEVMISPFSSSIANNYAQMFAYRGKTTATLN
ncbi:MULTISPECIES: MbnP family protein [Spirosoma]|uniref:Copper-binding protein MbnP-like domain-containing protein n=1 Tax=Spirosoma sordidisoli TaxID=2502893 RepID=A0A4Q2UPV7_9BACT|nr:MULTISPECIES: MbnP family protein [Spirosoma]RYC71763.1 hypothetical protein EQG79_06440 [Spirosoma sordidisoli]